MMHLLSQNTGNTIMNIQCPTKKYRFASMKSIKSKIKFWTHLRQSLDSKLKPDPKFGGVKRDYILRA